MCLITPKVQIIPTIDQIKQVIIKVTEKPKYVYKRFCPYYTPETKRKSKTTHTTPYRNFKWKIGEVVEVEEFGITATASDLERGKVKVSQGLHAFCSRKTAGSENFGYYTKKMLIPKGTKYILGEDDEIVALKMKLLDDRPKRSNTTTSKKRVVKKRKKK